MKQGKFLCKMLSVLLTFAFTAAIPAQSITSFAADTSQSDEYDGMTAEEKQAAIEQKLKEVNAKLDSLGEQSEETQEYIDTLDEKISYLQTELSLSESEIENSKEKIKTLQTQYEENEAEIKQLTVDLEKLEAENAQIEQSFSDNLQLYYKRARALYVSGDTSTLSMLLTCDDISSLLTRYEMIKRVSQADKNLLQSIQSEAKELSENKTAMENKKTTLAENQKTLKKTQSSLTTSISTLEQQQEDYGEKETAYKSEKSKSDELLKKIEDEKQTYSEYRNQDQAELEQVNAEIAAAAEKFKKQMEKSTTTTTKKATTTKAADSSDAQTTESTTATTAADSSKLSMTYPVPSQTTITCDYGSAGYTGHTGVDFSCPTGSTVVAAESGYVFYTKQLNYSYGYHIVIMHDKTDSVGNYVYTLYAHNSELLVSAGDYVTKGQAIAKSGSTGNSTGPHCHFEVRTPTADYSNCVNPNYYLP